MRLYSLFLEQSLWDEKFNVRVGRIAAGDDFAASPLYWLPLTNAIDGCPISLPINFPFSVYPTATWGTRARIWWTRTVATVTGIYNADPMTGRNAAHGMDFSLKLGTRGMLIMHEFGYFPNLKKEDKDLSFLGWQGMPGHYKVGLFYDTGNFNDFLRDENGGSYIQSSRDPQVHAQNYGMYFHLDQLVFKEKEDPNNEEGFTPFFVATLAPDCINEFPFFIDGALLYKGLIPKRDNDVTVLGFAYGKWSRSMANAIADLRDYKGGSAAPPRREMVLDFSYKIQLHQWFFLQPDMQYTVWPGGTGDIMNAFLLGMRIGMTF